MLLKYSINLNGDYFRSRRQTRHTNTKSKPQAVSRSSPVREWMDASRWARARLAGWCSQASTSPGSFPSSSPSTPAARSTRLSFLPLSSHQPCPLSSGKSCPFSCTARSCPSSRQESLS